MTLTPPLDHVIHADTILDINSRNVTGYIPEPLRAEVKIVEKLETNNTAKGSNNIVGTSATSAPNTSIRNDATCCTGPVRYTGDIGSTSPSTKTKDTEDDGPNLIETPYYLEKILGTWKGVIGPNLVSIRFEFTNQTKMLLAFFTQFTVPTVPFNRHSHLDNCPEVLSPKVNYNSYSKELFIEDATLGTVIAWVINDNIIGKLTDGSHVNIVKQVY